MISHNTPGLAGARVTVMGLGLHGGGAAVTRYLVSQGAEVTVTDLRSKDALAAGLKEIEDLPVRLVLGRHEEEDFSRADFVVKNPAVVRHSPFLRLAHRIETDLSLFLRRFSGPLLTVTGTKGKSSTVGALHYGLRKAGYNARLGGNITISPLSFLEDLHPEDPVVLELSSFQLGDLTLVENQSPSPGEGLLRPQIGIITSFFRDHLDYYGSMERYFADKEGMAAAVRDDGSLILGTTGEYARRFGRASRAPIYWAGESARDALAERERIETYGGVLLRKGGIETHSERFSGGALELPLPTDTPDSPALRLNRGMVLLALSLYGVAPDTLRECLEGFPGVEHRLEYCGTIDGVRIYNDSAATVPEASLEAVHSFSAPVHLIAGGTDKDLRYEPMGDVAREAKRLYLLAGSATDKMLETLKAAPAAAAPAGPFEDVAACLTAALREAAAGEIVIFSPGCASFEKFENEFHRGRVFKTLVKSYCEE